MPAKPLTPEQLADAARLEETFLKAKAHDASLTQESLAHACGWKTQGAANQYIKGKIPLNLRALLKFSSALGVSPETISPRLAAEIGGTATILGQEPRRNNKDKAEVHLEQFDTGGAMGAGVLLRDQPGVIKSWSVSPEWLHKNVRSHSGAQNLCIVTGFGDSMKPMFNPGDPLIVDTGVKSVDFDAIYFFRVENEGFIKRLQRIPGEGIRVISTNKEYESWTIRPNMDFEVFGRVLKVWCSEDF